jgi:hypothetical protein
MVKLIPLVTSTRTRARICHANSDHSLTARVAIKLFMYRDRASSDGSP